MERNSSTFDVRMNVDLYVRIKAQIGNDAEYAVTQILIDKLLKSGVVYRIDPRIITTTPMIDAPIHVEEMDEVKH
jgi:hypothetical protein